MFSAEDFSNEISAFLTNSFSKSINDPSRLGYKRVLMKHKKMVFYTDVIYYYYPQNVSCYSGNYEDTLEYSRLLSKIEEESDNWNHLLKEAQ